MNVNAPSRSISAPSRPAAPVTNLVIETLDEFAGGVYTTYTTADYISGAPSAAACN